MKKKFANGLYFSTNQNLIQEEEQKQETDYDKKVVINTLKIKNNKLITIVSNVCSSDLELAKIAKEIKSKCGCGGSIKDGEIVIQGDCKEKVFNIMKDLGFNNVKK
jgi:translation initiation factor 1